jgi:hypothetical protein
VITYTVAGTKALVKVEENWHSNVTFYVSFFLTKKHFSTLHKSTWYIEEIRNYTLVYSTYIKNVKVDDSFFFDSTISRYTA